MEYPNLLFIDFRNMRANKNLKTLRTTKSNRVTTPLHTVEPAWLSKIVLEKTTSQCEDTKFSFECSL